jgi:NADP-dependent 3-hydroxy acid dehydrogenase YdfG
METVSAQGRFDGRVALVTGASSGIGEGIALTLGKMGFTVLLTARRKEKLQRVAAAINAERGKAFAIAADLTDDQQLKRLIAIVKDEYGSVEVLVNNAAKIELQRIDELDINSWDSVINLNLRVPAALCASFLPGMRQRRRGYIVNICSEAGVFSYGGMGAYGVSKHALRALTDLVLSESQDYGIKAWSICPGDVDTERTQSISTPAESARYLKVGDINEVVKLLLSQGSNVKMGPTILLRTMLPPSP